MDPLLEQYEATSLDWQAIRTLAVRAAHETRIPQAPGLSYVTTPGWRPGGRGDNDQLIDVCGPHWLLDYAFNRYESPEDDPREEEYTQYLFVLTVDGDLKVVAFNEESATGTHNGQGWFRAKNDHNVTPMADHHVEDFDFERRCTQQGVNWGDQLSRCSGEAALLQQRKGDGLRRILEDIRTGRVRQRQSVSLPLDHDADTRYTLPGLTDFHLSSGRRAKVMADIRHRQAKRAEVTARRARGMQMRASITAIRKLRTLAGGLAVAGITLGLFCSSLRSNKPGQWVEFVSFPWLTTGLAMLVAWIILGLVKNALWKASARLM